MKMAGTEYRKKGRKIGGGDGNSSKKETIKRLVLTKNCEAQNLACRHLRTASSVRGPARCIRSSSSAQPTGRIATVTCC